MSPYNWACDDMKQSPCPNATTFPTPLGKGAPLNTSLKLYSPVVAFRM